MIKVIHGIRVLGKYTSTEIPKKFKRLIDAKILMWKKEGLNPHHGYLLANFYIENHALFTMAYDIETKVYSIAIMNPLDYFSINIGENIAIGRLKRFIGNHKRDPYLRNPKFIYCKDKCWKCTYWIPKEQNETRYCSNPLSPIRKINNQTKSFHTCKEFRK